jgi:hypothetical protein
VTGACNDLAGALPNVPSPKEIAELPQKAATDVLNGIKDDIVSTMAAGVAKAASWLLGKTLDAITGSTTPDVTSKWFVGQYAQMAGLAALFAIPFLLFAAIQSVAATDWGILARAALVETPLAFIFTAMAVGVTALLLAVSDGMSDWITHSSHADTESFVKSMVKVYAATGTLAVPPFLELVAAITAVAGAFLVWLELIIREAGIYICLAFVPFVMAARIWPRIAHWCRRLVEVGVVIILSKFAIAAIFAIAAAALRPGGAQQRPAGRVCWRRARSLSGVCALCAAQAHPDGRGRRRGHWQPPTTPPGRPRDGAVAIPSRSHERPAPQPPRRRRRWRWSWRRCRCGRGRRAGCRRRWRGRRRD